MKGLATIDIIVFLFYFIIVAGYGYWIYQRKKKVTADTKDFFLAEGSLTWWAIGASLIASNISAEQMIGMSMVTAFELNDFVAARISPRQPYSTHASFGAAAYHA